VTALALAILAAGTYAMKSSGLFAGTRQMPPHVADLLALMPAALLAALTATQIFGGTGGIVIDARLAGVAAAAIALALRAPFVVVVGVATIITALIRLAGH